MPGRGRSRSRSQVERRQVETRQTTAGLLERERELEQLHAAISAARAGRGGLTMMEGAAGIGKSRLLRAAIEQASAAGLAPLSARSAEPERDFAFGITLQLFERRVAVASEDARRQLFAGAAALALPLFAEPNRETARASEPTALQGLLHGLFWLTANLAEHTPLLLAIDDLHWSDEPSLRFLLYLLRRLEELPVAVVATRRPAAGGRLDGELAGDSLATRVALQPLSGEAVATLLADSLERDVGERFAASSHHATGGNPFLVRAMTKALYEEGLEPSDENAPRIAELRPEAVRQQVLVRIARRGEDAVALAGAAAVLGDRALIPNAAAIAGLSLEAAADAADALMAADIFSDATPLSFTHPLVRATVYEDLPAARRGRWHAHAARLLHDEHASGEQVAVQLLAATRVGEGWAAEVLRQAADRALRSGSPESAIRYLTRALREPLERSQRTQTLIDLARAKAMIGEASAESDLDHALALIDEPRTRAQAHQTLGSVLYTRGDVRAAAHQFERAMLLLDDEQDPLARGLGAAYYSAASLTPELAPKARAHIEPLLARPAGGETRSERSALAGAAVYLATSGAPRDQAIALARHAWGDGQLLADEGPDGWAWSLVTGAFGWTDEFEASLEICHAVIAQARSTGSLMAYATASFAAVQSAHTTGRLADACAYAEATLDAVRYGWRTYAAALAATYARVLIDQDELEHAEKVLEVLADPAYGTPPGRAWAHTIRGRLRLIQGRPQKALDDLLAAQDIFVKSFGPHDSFVMWRADAAVAAHQLGRSDLATELIEHGARIAARTRTPTHQSDILRARVQLQPEDAVELLTEAQHILEHSQARTEQIRVRTELGSALRRAGKRGQARQLLSEALEQAHSAGARRIERQARQELEIAGARPRRLAFSGADALTASERRIAEMAAQGTPNRDIAQALFVTPRTVEQHLYNAYKKLGIQSRKQLEAALRNPGQPGTMPPAG